MLSHFMEQGNGILLCYNMFPPQFGKITRMTAYLPQLREMGFNAVWINPIQRAGDIENFIKQDKQHGVTIGNRVTRSLYAMQDPNMISPYFSVAPRDKSGELTVSAQEAQQLDTTALREFTNTARANGLVPLFDLVLNHLATDTSLYTDPRYAHWFTSIHPHFKDTRGFNYENATTRHEIIEQFWKPFIRKYMEQYGFDGVRVDAVGYVHPEVRHEIYKYIHQLSQELAKPRPVILDELLFCKHPLPEEVERLKLTDNGPTHITIEAYSAHPNENGDLPRWLKEQEALKATVIFQRKDGAIREDVHGGCINFSGNHDMSPLALTILYEMAEEQFSTHIALQAAYQVSASKYSSSENEVRKKIFTYHLVKDIENKMVAGNQAINHEVEQRMRKKIATCALTSSGGWYLLAGDETADLLPKAVFRRRKATDQDYYPQRIHQIFLDDHFRGSLETALRQLAETDILQDTEFNMNTTYRELINYPEQQQKLLAAYIENIKNQINYGDPDTCLRLKTALATRAITVNFDIEDYVACERNAENGWRGQHDLRGFIKEINTLLQQLPASKPGFWSESITLADHPNLAITVRKNGPGFAAETDIVIVNLDPTTKIEITEPILRLIAEKLHQRLATTQTIHSGVEKVYLNIISCAAQQKIHTDNTISLRLTSMDYSPGLFARNKSAENIDTALPATIEKGVTGIPRRNGIDL